MAQTERPGPNYLDLGKETVAALLSVIIASVTIWMLVSTYRTGSKVFVDKDPVAVQAMKDAYERSKDLLLYGLSILGTVLGYYFGRIPAEKGASAARKDASSARGELVETAGRLATTAQSNAAIAQSLSQSQSRLQRLAKGSEKLVGSAGAILKKAKQESTSHATLGSDPHQQDEDLQTFERDLHSLEAIIDSDN